MVMQGPRLALLAAALLLLAGGCLVSFDVPSTDASGDPGGDDIRRDDLVVPEGESEDTAPPEEGIDDDGAEPPDLASCGNGVVDPEEECDGTAPESCTTSCGTQGTRTCGTDCRWTACVPPGETCDGLDQDCDGYADEDLWALRGSPLLLDETDEPSILPSAAWAGDRFCAVWEKVMAGPDQLYLAAAAADMTLLTPEMEITVSTGGAHDPAIAWDGTGLGAAWTDLMVTDLSRDPYAALLSVEGAGRSVPLNLAGMDAGDDTGPAIVWTGTQLAVAWAGPSGVFLSLIAADGGSAARTAVSAGDGTDACIAWSGSLFGVFWEERSGGGDIAGALVEADGTVAVPDLRLHDGDEAQVDPACAFGAGAFEVLCADDGSGAWQVFGTSVLPDGTIASAEYLVTACTGDCREPAIAWAGDSWVVAAVDERVDAREIFVFRAAGDGSRLGADIVVSPPGLVSGHPALAWGGDTLAAAFEGHEAGPSNAYLASVGCP
jgi:hypothetical protein